ncbi:MAG: hypothetical protein HY611_08960 [Elusimicrobia bacterium]|nr:hypothetical protein [Elusimicrobiota bacterium]
MRLNKLIAVPAPAVLTVLALLIAPPTAAQPLEESTETIKAETPASAPVSAAWRPLLLSGAMLTPTAYRANGAQGLGLNLDFTASYYIGRLYGQNHLEWSTRKTNFIDRVGVWFLNIDGKMQIQEEGRIKPATAVGAMAIFNFRDVPQPALQGPFNLTVNTSNPNQKAMTGAYLVFTKKFHPKAYVSLGYLGGNAVNQISFLSEFLTPEALAFSGHTGQTVTGHSMLFGSAVYHVKPKYPISVEFLKPQAVPSSPMLFNFHIGSYLRLNFDIAYLKFQGGYDLLGFFNFRYSFFPRFQSQEAKPAGIIK